MKALSLLIAVLLTLCLGCSDDSTPADAALEAAPPVEMGMEASVDAGTDAAPPVEMGLEASAEASVDATPDDLSSE